MQTGKFNVLLDVGHGSSGKGSISTRLADKHNITKISSANQPNAGHTSVFKNGPKFVAKAIPTAAILRKVKGFDMDCFISPGSGFDWAQLVKEWDQCGRPNLNIHQRANIVDESHKLREREGAESTAHIASTMQGSGVAIADKVLRKANCKLAMHCDTKQVFQSMVDSGALTFEGPSDRVQDEFVEKVRIIDPMDFRNLMHSLLRNGHTWLHEGSQGYALSIDHGNQWPYLTSRNCTIQAAMDYMAVPPQMVGDVYLNLRTYPIRVGNLVENGVQKGYSGDFYTDSKEVTWEQVASESGMPSSEAVALAERERTTVTKRIRRVSTFSNINLLDAVQTNGATKLCLNFIQYIDWSDAGLKGGKEAFAQLSKKSRAFIAKIEEVAQLPVVMIGTGANHDEVIDLL